MTLLEARQVGRMIEGRFLFRHLDLTVGVGERVAVMGPSGSGKSSLLALLAGLHRPDEGEVSFDGEPVTGLIPPRQGVSMILQGYGLVSVLTGTENIEIALLAAGRSPKESRVQALSALDAVGLAAVGDQLVDTLSGGQQQRTAVARALALQPRLLIADEPTAELDPVARSLVVALLTGASAVGTALVLATHDPEVAETCDRIVDMRENR